MQKLVLSAVILSIAPFSYASLPDIETAVMNKDYAQARDLAFKTLNESKDPQERTEAQYYYGLAQLRLGKYAEARSSFRQVMDSRPSRDNYDKAALSLIEGFYMEGSYSEALNAARTLFRKSPRSSFLSLIYLKIAGADLKLMRWEEAGEFLNKIIKEFPGSPEAPIARQLLEEKQYFAVQVGSFLDKARAISLIDGLKGDGQYAYVVETSAPGGGAYYRVRVGQMSSLKDAQDLKKRLDKLGYPTLIYP